MDKDKKTLKCCYANGCEEKTSTIYCDIHYEKQYKILKDMNIKYYTRKHIEEMFRYGDNEFEQRLNCNCINLVVTDKGKYYWSPYKFCHKHDKEEKDFFRKLKKNRYIEPEIVKTSKEAIELKKEYDDEFYNFHPIKF